MLKAVILAGGRGTRLRPITDYIPKPMIPIRNIPLIEWQIRYLEKFGITDIIICTGYKEEFIKNYLDTRKMKANIQFSIEDTPLGTGGAIKNAGFLINAGGDGGDDNDADNSHDSNHDSSNNKKTSDSASFLVINGDVITDINLTDMLQTPNCIASINLQTKFGVLETDGIKITKFSEKTAVSHLWMNAGIYHLQKTILDDLPDTGDIEKTTFPKYAQDDKLNIVQFGDGTRWYSIDSFKDLQECASEIEDIITE